LHPIAIYTYDAGGERIIKHNSTNVAIYENALKVGEKTQPDFMIYPSGMLVFRPSFGGDGGGSYTKHYFAGTQRVSSKIGTTTNLGNFLEEWQQQEQSSPSYPAITTQAQMDKAKNAANKVYTAFGITYATPAGNTSFTPIAAFTPPSGAGGLETDHYFFHPDHLGSSNYITNFVGEVSQHSEYFAFGETFIEEHKDSHNSPYKFNGKELDEESGLYYYGARYYDPRISIWASVDPYSLSIEYYKKDSANGGVFYSKNLSVYSYSYLNPILYKDPDGKIPALAGAVVGILTEILAQLGVNMLVEHQNLSTAWSNLDKSDIFVAGALGAATGFIDGGTSRLVSFLSNPRNQKLVQLVIPLVVDLIVELIEGVAKNVLNLENGDSLDIKGALNGALTEVGLKQLASFFKTSKKLTNKLDRLEKVAQKDIKKAQKEIDRGSTKAKYKNKVNAGNKKIEAINTTRAFLDIPKSAFGEAGSNVEYKDGKISKKKG
jgi:RHS repeat-associated protein